MRKNSTTLPRAKLAGSLLFPVSPSKSSPHHPSRITQSASLCYPGSHMGPFLLQELPGILRVLPGDPQLAPQSPKMKTVSPWAVFCFPSCFLVPVMLVVQLVIRIHSGFHNRDTDAFSHSLVGYNQLHTQLHGSP